MPILTPVTSGVTLQASCDTRVGTPHGRLCTCNPEHSTLNRRSQDDWWRVAVVGHAPWGCGGGDLRIMMMSGWGGGSGG